MAQNSWLGLEKSKSYTYYTLDPYHMYLATRLKDNPTYMVFWIVEDENTANFSRNVETIWDALAATGGFFRVINLFFLAGLIHY